MAKQRFRSTDALGLDLLLSVDSGVGPGDTVLSWLGDSLGIPPLARVLRARLAPPSCWTLWAD